MVTVAAALGPAGVGVGVGVGIGVADGGAVEGPVGALLPPPPQPVKPASAALPARCKKR
jgi:hypothetical protein